MSEPQEVSDILDGLTDPTADEVYQAVREYDTRHVVAAVGSKADAAGGGGGGSQPVACVLARDAPFDIRLDSLDTNVLWDALYDNLWDLNPLAEIPDGLGLTFSFDGSSSLIVPDEAGIWTFSYFAERAGDNAWGGYFHVGGVGLSIPWVQQLKGDGSANGPPFMAGSISGPLPSGAQIDHLVTSVAEANAGTYTCTQVYLSIVRHT